MGYAAGALPQAFDLVVATHVSSVDERAGRALTGFEELGAPCGRLEECEVGEDSLEKDWHVEIAGMAPNAQRQVP